MLVLYTVWPKLNKRYLNISGGAISQKFRTHALLSLHFCFVKENVDISADVWRMLCGAGDLHFWSYCRIQDAQFA